MKKPQTLPIPLRSVAKVNYTTAPIEINHHNITRVIDVFVNVRGHDVGSVAASIDNYISQMHSDRAQGPEGYFIQMTGEVKAMRESFKSLGFGFVLSAILDYVVMLFPFRSLI